MVPKIWFSAEMPREIFRNNVQQDIAEVDDWECDDIYREWAQPIRYISIDRIQDSRFEGNFEGRKGTEQPKKLSEIENRGSYRLNPCRWRDPKCRFYPQKK